MRRLWLLALFACNGPEVTTEFTATIVGTTTTTDTSSGGPTTLPTTNATTSEEPTDTGSSTSTTAPITGTSESGGQSSTGSGTASSGDSSSTGEATSSGSSGSGESSSTGPALPTCSDGEVNQDETDVDCGGATCDGCGFGQVCGVDVDCADGWCDGGLCGDPDCLADADCDALDTPCVEASCNLETRACDLAPINDGMVCDDLDACSTGETCAAGACGDGATVDCSGFDSVCGLGSCDPLSGCVVLPLPDSEGKACDDGWVCTPNDTCKDGVCGVGGPGYIWFEDFSQPDPEIELGALWAIGPAVASQNGKNGADPDDDHTPNDDKMLAGTVIGGLYPNGNLAKACLTLPALDTSGETSLWLSFWRHLHTDYFPFIHNSVEVWNGSEWILADSGYMNPGIGDPIWTLVFYDLAPYVNDAMQVRICYETQQAAKASAGWSVDDVTIGPFVCTPNG